MSFPIADTAALVSQIAKDEQVRVTVGKRYCTAGLIGFTALAAFTGPGVVAPIAFVPHATFDKDISLSEAITLMDQCQKLYLVARVKQIAARLNATDVVQMSLMLADNEALRAEVVRELITMITYEMKICIQV